MTPDRTSPRQRSPRKAWTPGAFAALALLGLPASVLAQDEGTAPQVSCFETVKQGGLSDEYSATQLCRGARSNAPAKCFLRVQEDGSLTQGQAVQLCQFATAQDNPASCYLQAKSKSFSDDSRLIQLCQPPVTQFLRYCPVYVQ
ncbi:hypothetical protein LZ198_39545 [Myxococcus sp. K15C18031901]|uniref:hypothetical protein n=1 Tax=Myxococcus dinghuensis TaxID=2906761 RepID=UPI0020A78809|nr:hypothetical protein [Myxococcus dinghuensis]MCP3104978.1 hypothetical protein [Myxococcus dinghuensis]